MSSRSKPSIAPSVQSFAEDTAKRGEEVVRELLPAKMVELDELMKHPDFEGLDATDEKTMEALDRAPLMTASDSESGSESESDSDAGSRKGKARGPQKRKRRRRDAASGAGSASATAAAAAAPALVPVPGAVDGAAVAEASAAGAAKDVVLIPSNRRLLRMIKVVRHHVTEAMEMLSTAKMWIQLSIPRIEDGNNFGVSVQEECVNELARVEDSGYTVLDSISKYLTTRAKLVSRYLKYRGVEDYRQGIAEVDLMEYINLHMCVRDLRNNYAILHDTIMKNLDRVKKPRGHGSALSTMY